MLRRMNLILDYCCIYKEFPKSIYVKPDIDQCSVSNNQSFQIKYLSFTQSTLCALTTLI